MGQDVDAYRVTGGEWARPPGRTLLAKLYAVMTSGPDHRRGQSSDGRPTQDISHCASWALLAAIGALQLWYLAPLARPGEPVGADLSIHLAEAAHLGRAIRAGDIQWWNPSANLGFPSGFYYSVLPQLLPALLWVLGGGTVPLLALFKLMVAVPLVLLPVSTYTALRALRFLRTEALGAALTVGLVCGKSPWGLGIDSVFTMGLYPQAWAMLCWPLALAYGVRFLGEGQCLARAVFLIHATGLCHPLVGVSLVPALLVAPWWRGDAGTKRRAAGRGAVLLALGLAASAFFWVPMLVYYNAFGGFPQRAASEGGMALGRFVHQLATGMLLDDGRWPVLTALVGVGMVTAVWRTGARFLLTSAAAYAGLIIIGSVIGPVPDDLLPFTRFLAPCQWYLAVLAGSGTAMAATRLWRRLAWEGDAGRARCACWGRLAVSAVLLLALALAVEGAQRHAARRVRVVTDIPAAHRAELDEMLRALAALPPGRVLATAEFRTGSHWWMYLPFVASEQPALRAYGGAALQSSSNFVYLRAERPGAHVDLYNVRYILAQGHALPLMLMVPGTEPLYRTAHYVLLGTPAPGYFQPIEVAGTVPAAKRDRIAAVSAWLARRAPRDTRRLEIGASGGRAGSGGCASVLKEWHGYSHYGARVHVEGGGAATVALSVTFHPLWRASIDGMPMAVRRVTPDVMAVDVPPGTHTVEFTFRRPPWMWGLLTFDVVLIMLVVIGGEAWRRLRAQRA
jgi:hypothetical protein